MKLHLSCLLLLISHHFIAQCLVKEVELLNQFDIDTFSQNHPQCDSLMNLFIGDEVESLEPLIQLKHVDNLYIWNTTKLKTLSGLDSLKSIGGELYIRSNDSLSTINSLAQLEQLNDFKVENNTSIESFKGLDKIKELSSCIVLSNPLIVDLEGLGGLSFCRSLSLSGNISFDGLSPNLGVSTILLNQNRVLESISDMSSSVDLSQVRSLFIVQTERFSLDGIDQMDSLVILYLNLVINPDIEAFAELQKPIKNISIELCQNLQNINALRDKAIKSLYLGDLPNLTDISGLNNLDSDSYVALVNLPMLEDISIFNESDTARFNIKGNEKLSKCAMSAICNGLYANNTSVDIADNATGCNGNEEVKSQCLTSTQNIENLTSIYPNPVRNDLYLDTEVNYDSYEILDMNGKLISEGRILYNKISFSSLTSNTYLLKLQNSSSIDIVKIIKI